TASRGWHANRPSRAVAVWSAGRCRPAPPGRRNISKTTTSGCRPSCSRRSARLPASTPSRAMRRSTAGAGPGPRRRWGGRTCGTVRPRSESVATGAWGAGWKTLSSRAWNSHWRCTPSKACSPDAMASGYVGRFAPSPTGPLHPGSLVAALASWLDARAHGGRWLVRIEDVDTPRCIPGAAETILQQLADCALVPDDEPVWQSQRDSLYQAALDQLIHEGRAYPYACSRKDIEHALA